MGRLFDWRNDFWVCGLDFWLLRVFYVEVIIPLNYPNLWVYSIKFWIIIKKCYCQSCKQDLRCMFKITNKEKTKFSTGMTRIPFHTIVKGGLWKSLHFPPAKTVCGWNISSLMWKTSISMWGHLIIKWIQHYTNWLAYIIKKF